MDDYEKVATALLILFGALIIGGLMAVHIAVGSKAGFLFALGGGIVGWFSAFAILFDRPKIYLGLIVLAVLCVAMSVGLYVR
ncbi:MULTISPECIES: hypothetical protein [unclassified Bartonella]|uniref:hypothetical protein n=1 Tax=unclassified Bartonella TaxID=2645622 RepID=UPI0015FA8DDE|nr:MULTISPECIES: hypothetical protein [unclassified Bartonella]UXM96016.1 hypothetical protein N5853_05180 [Bartonella sp. HY329]UXN04163.1 hypothetical protein N6B01_03775 [Bartonella sp. HY406]UXN07152.1 hypothetical protein N6A79_03855 [Bartonella sp. HY761]UXN10341.1 hypothetical protein N5852_05190 [Bartonella sp. HY328]